MSRARKLAAAWLCACLPALALAAPAGAASFGLSGLDVGFSAKDGSPSLQAGSHPFAFTTHVGVVTEEPEAGKVFPVEEAKDLEVSFPAGLVGDPTAVPRCSAAQFLAGNGFGECPDATALGFARVEFGASGEATFQEVPVFNLIPSPGEAAKVGFIVEGRAPVVIDTEVNPDPPYNLIAPTRNISQALFFLSADLTIWGVPADPAHDSRRGQCLLNSKSCPVSIPEVPFLTLPTSCQGPLSFGFEADSWQHPGSWTEPIFASTHDESGRPLGTGGCEKLGFAPRMTARPTSTSAAGPTGLDVSVDVADEGLANPSGYADSTIERAEVTLPEGMTLNPSQAEGLGVCSEAAFAAESASSGPGQGCPESSKIGSVEVETPLLEGRLLKGSLFVAKPYENPFDTLIALYMTVKDPELGIDVNLAGKVTPDPHTGRLIGTFGEPGHELPQLPFSRFALHFREGARSPLATPPACGTYATVARFTPWADPASSYVTTSDFKVTSGPGGGPCPPAGAPPFHPGFEAGTLSNQAGAYSPFDMRLTRADGEGDLTRFSAKLPPGVIGRLAGLDRCPAAAIALARSRSGPHGGAEELAHPSCPATSQIGHLLAGAGVGPELTYVPGSLYLAGPYNGAPLSVVAIVPAVAGPFDVGTVVVQEALRIDPRSAEVSADGASSDPIPHILAGIPLSVRDVRVDVDRPGFTLNPTSCAESSTQATIWGGGANVFSSADDLPVAASQRFQAAGCAALGFKPSLALKLRGGTRRGAFPALRGTYTQRPGDANLRQLVLTLPHSAFLEQGHFGTICTRVQYAASPGDGAQCPAASVYGQATASTPLLSEPLQGPVYLRSSDHNLPDLVASLHGIVDVEAVARIDSKNGGIRATFAAVPDAPLSKVIVDMQGGKKGLIVNSTNLCASPHHADARFSGQNGKAESVAPLVGAQCSRGQKKRRTHRARR